MDISKKGGIFGQVPISAPAAGSYVYKNGGSIGQARKKGGIFGQVPKSAPTAGPCVYNNDCPTHLY